MSSRKGIFFLFVFAILIITVIPSSAVTFPDLAVAITEVDNITMRDNMNIDIQYHIQYWNPSSDIVIRKGPGYNNVEIEIQTELENPDLHLQMDTTFDIHETWINSGVSEQKYTAYLIADQGLGDTLPNGNIRIIPKDYCLVVSHDDNSCREAVVVNYGFLITIQENNVTLIPPELPNNWGEMGGQHSEFPLGQNYWILGMMTLVSTTILKQAKRIC